MNNTDGDEQLPLSPEKQGIGRQVVQLAHAVLSQLEKYQTEKRSFYDHAEPLSAVRATQKKYINSESMTCGVLIPLWAHHGMQGAHSNQSVTATTRLAA